MTAFKAFPVINLSATGANIQRLRKLCGYSVSDLQNYFGFDAPQAIYRWQRGETLPSVDNLLALGYLLEVPIEKILVFQTIGLSESPQDNSCGDCSVIPSALFSTGMAGSPSSIYRMVLGLRFPE